ncbi:MAG: multiple sugar transport system permease protein [Petroclostridium sp.]|jgi:multiple sugar transport system permease protein|nr:multiple sugar transport system permease protein [Petroclostridium sp.]
MVNQQINTSTAVIQQQKKSSAMMKKKLNDYAWAYFMVFPTMAGLIILNIWPIFQTIYLSFTKYGDFGRTKWIGMGNYVKLFHDTVFLKSMYNTFVYTIGVVPFGVFLSLVLAVLLNANIRGKTIYRTIYFLPVVSTPAAIAMVWKMLFITDYGLLNYVLSLVGINKIQWLTSPKFAIISVIIVGIWSMAGYYMVILLSGLQEIPKTFYEAADIDGAGPLYKFFRITIPLVSPTLFFVVVLSLTSSLQVFDTIFMMFEKKSPVLEDVQSMAYLFYKYGFQMNEKGYASAIVVVLLVIILLITAIQLKMQKKWVHYQ